ncbi:hypothetical protein RHDE110596_01215 [Prescottella defluvii]|uniref:hypothetical protein n=1 Tax=Prescottella defluvii TaxID=1323361 RepID=UPI00068AF86C|nr:hypothetical protein [Prescottella defluvii]
MRQSEQSPLLLTRPDIAKLAKVRRAVVSAWARRYCGEDRPFPRPTVVDGILDKFDADEVVEWLRSRGLGNNSSFAEDVAIHAALDHGTSLHPHAVIDGVTALLAVKTMLGESLGELTPDDLLDEVEELDPDNEFLCDEIAALGEELGTFARYTDRMSDAAFTAVDAFESVMARRFRMQRPELSDTALTPAALSLCARVSVALADDHDTLFVDPAPTSTDLLVAVRAALPEYAEPTVMTGASSVPAARLALRRLAAHGLRRESPPEGGFGADFSVGRPAVFLTQYPSASTIDYSDVDVLAEIENISLQMGPGQCAVIIGPAATLVDPLRDRDADSVRSDLLRSGHLRAVIRLSEGLLPARPGTSMALWVLGAQDGTISVAERHTVLADLSAVELADDVVDGVIADVAAAMGTWKSVRAHAFRFSHVHKIAELLATGGVLTAKPKVHRPRVDAGEAAARVLELVGAIDAAEVAGGGLDLWVEYRAAKDQQFQTAGELAAAKELRVLSGNRIDAVDIEADGAVPVIGADEVLGRCEIGSRGIDRLTFVTDYPSGRYTEPGDIVFCTSPSFGVIVDVEGSSVAMWPARILRIADSAASGLIPELVARHLQSRGVGAKPPGAIRSGSAWKTWEIPRVQADQVGVVTAALADLRERRAAARRLLHTIDDLTITLVDGVAHGALTVAPAPPTVPEKG